MKHPILQEARSLEEAFFLKHDAKLIEEMRRLESAKTRKQALTKVSGIKDEKVLEHLIAQEIHAETLAAFSLVPVIEVAWADGVIQSEEQAVILAAVEKTGIKKDSVSYHLVQEWMKQRPGPKLMQCWKDYTRALMAHIKEEDRSSIRDTVLHHARAVAEAVGGFLGYGRISGSEQKVLRSLEKSFHAKSA
jgi:hypothetical protein